MFYGKPGRKCFAAILLALLLILGLAAPGSAAWTWGQENLLPLVAE